MVQELEFDGLLEVNPAESSRILGACGNIICYDITKLLLRMINMLPRPFWPICCRQIVTQGFNHDQGILRHRIQLRIPPDISKI